MDLKKFLILLLFLAVFLNANILEKYTWENRIVIVFGDEKFHAKVDKIYANQKYQLDDRDIVWIDVGKGKSFNRIKDEQLYKQYNIQRGENRFLLIGKDGGVKLELAEVVSPSYLYNIIDAMPMRQQEMREKY